MGEFKQSISCSVPETSLNKNFGMNSRTQAVILLFSPGIIPQQETDRQKWKLVHIGNIQLMVIDQDED